MEYVAALVVINFVAVTRVAVDILLLRSRCKGGSGGGFDGFLGVYRPRSGGGLLVH